MLQRRPLSFSEKGFLNNGSFVQIGLQVANKNATRSVIEGLKRTNVGFHLKVENDELVQTNETPIIKLPSSISSAEDAAIFMSHHTSSVNYTKGLAVIGYSDNFVACSSSHMLSDGRSLVYMVNNCLNKHHPPMVAFPRTMDDVFASKLTTPKDIANKHYPSLTAFTRSVTPCQQDLPNLMTEYCKGGLPIESLQCYDKSTKQLKGLTDSLWVAFALATSTMAKEGIPSSLSCCNCVDLRAYMDPRDLDLSIGNMFTSIPIFTDAINGSTTLAEIARQMRQNFRKSQSDGMIYSALRNCIESPPDLGDTRLFTELSNVGNLEYEPPILDVYLSSRMRSRALETFVPILTYTNHSNGQYNLITRLQISPSCLSDEEATRLSGRIHYILQELPPSSVTLKEAYKLVSESIK